MPRDVVGRESELGSARALLRDARAGRGGVLALVGPPGVGKSLLLDTAAAEAASEGVDCLRAVGVEAERDLPYAGLSALLGPLLRYADCLTAAQAGALRVALGDTEGPPPGRLVLGGAVLGLLAAAAERAPVLVAVDDLQWLDRPSAEVLLFAARRLQAERVAVVLASRPEETGDGDGLGALLRSVSPLEVTGLPADQCGRLLGHVAPEVAAALAERTGGNPLAMLEAADLLDEDVRLGRQRLPRDLPPTSAGDAYRLRLSALPPAAREGARVLAYGGGAPRELVVQVLAKLSISLAQLEPFEQTGLGVLSDHGVRWRHPLARSVAAEGTADQVRRIHGAFAEVWESVPGSRPQWAWHMAEAASGPDEDVACALAAVARLSADRDASLEAADAWERAAQLGQTPDLRREWLGRAARAAFRGGATARAAHLYDLALDVRRVNADEEATGLLLHERGRAEHALGRPVAAYDFLLRAATTGEARRRVWAAAEGVFAGMYARRPDLAAAAAARAVEAHDPADPTQRFLALHAAGAAASLRGEAEAASQQLRAATTLLGEERLLDAEPELLLWAVNADLFLDAVPPPLSPYVGDGLARMRESGELMWSPRVVRLAAVRGHHRGEWDPAYAAFEEATELSRMSGQRTQVAEGLLLLAAIEAARGQRDLCCAHTAEAEEIVRDLEVSWLADGVAETRGLLHLTLGDAEGAVRCFARAPEKSPEARLGLVEATLMAGRPAEALLGDVDPDADEPALVVARSLVADDTGAAQRIAGEADGVESAFEAARWRYLAGAMLRRAGARREARQQLRLAEEVFASLRTGPWLERAQAELRASGSTLRKGPEGQALTASELRVATQVAEGRSNKEVAAALFLSPKTVEFHLGRAFRKLGVTNRTALAAALRQET